MKKIFVTTFLIIFITLIAGTTFARTGTVNTDGLNLRKTASTSADVLTQLDKNTQVEILDELDDWYKVSYKNQEGYLKKQYLDAEAESTTNIDNTEGNANENLTDPNTGVNENSTNSNTDTNGDSTNSNTGVTSNNQSALLQDAIVYALPLLNATQVANLQASTQVEVISKVGKWYYVMTDETAGWILASKLLETTSLEQNGNTENNTATNSTENNLTNNTENDNTTNTNSENSITNNTTNPNNKADSKYPKTMYVSVDAVNVRDKASTSSDIVGSKKLNDEVTVTGISGDWYTVNINGTNGYIKKDYLSDSKK